MNYRQLFFIEGRLIAEGSRYPIEKDRHGEIRKPTSDIYFCASCGEVFAKFPCLSGQGQQTMQWHSYRALCRRCTSPYMSNVPGSIWRSWDTPFLAALPEAVLQWEFERLLDQIERFPNDDRFQLPEIR